MPEIPRKADADRITAHLRSLTTSAWIGTARKRWPDFIFHFAELKNAVSILECGELKARSQRPMVVDTASPSVISNTEQQWMNQVRFYFRPRTPTQYQCEGFRPPSAYGSAGAHSPMPFVFLFDAKDVLTRETTRFSNGNLGKPGNRVDGTADFFEQLPFEEIYHDSAFGNDARDRIVNCRHAEIIVPERMELSPLKYIWCRSGAEYQTLLNSLSAAARTRYLKKIGAEGHGALHFRRWTYVEEVTLEQNQAIFRFNPSTITAGPFAAKIVIKAQPSYNLAWSEQQFMANKTLTLNISQLPATTPYKIELTLNGNRAYYGQFSPGDSAVLGARR
jgi:ssDNA thymidine ADP-ribosyltransferase, DarT